MPNFGKSTNNNWNILSRESKEKYVDEYEMYLTRIAAIENEFPEEKYKDDPAYLRYRERVHELRKMFGEENIGPDQPIESRKARLERLRGEKQRMIDKISERIVKDIQIEAEAHTLPGKHIIGGPGSCIDDYELKYFDQIEVDRAFPELIKESPWYYEGIYKNDYSARDLAKLLYGEKEMELTTDKTTCNDFPHVISFVDCNDNTKVCNPNIPNESYTYDINLKVRLPRERVIVDENAFDGNDGKVAKAYFDEGRINELKLKLVKMILDSECPFDFNCVGQDGGLRVTEDMIFRVKDNNKKK